MARPIKSNDMVVFIDDTPVTGCIDYKLNSDLSLWGESSLGSDNVPEYLLTENQVHKLDLTWYWGFQSPDTQLGLTNPAGGIIVTSGYHDFVIRDTAEQNLVSGGYLTNFNINASVGEIPQFTTSFDCNTRTHNTDTLVNPAADSLTGEFHVFRPQTVFVKNISVAPFISYDEGCIQSVDVSIALPRKPITKIGSKIPVTRAFVGPLEASVQIELIKDRATNMDSNYLNQTIRTTHTLDVTVGDSVSGSYDISVGDLTLQTIDESLSLDGLDTVTYSYKGFLGKNGISIRSGGGTNLVSSDGFTLISSDGFTITL